MIFVNLPNLKQYLISKGGALLARMAHIKALNDKVDSLGGTPGVKRYKALLTQTGTDAPVATILENTLDGTPVWSYDSTGYYICTLANGFPTTKTMINVGNETNTDIYSAIFINSDSEFGLFTSLLSNIAGGDNSILYGTSITVEVYP